jgi:hypothetical protein
LKDPKAAIPDGQVAHFRASSYDPRWVGKSAIVRGTVAGVDVDTRGTPQYAGARTGATAQTLVVTGNEYLVVEVTAAGI